MSTLQTPHPLYLASQLCFYFTEVSLPRPIYTYTHLSKMLRTHTADGPTSWPESSLYLPLPLCIPSPLQSLRWRDSGDMFRSSAKQKNSRQEMFKKVHLWTPRIEQRPGNGQVPTTRQLTFQWTDTISKQIIYNYIEDSDEEIRGQTECVILAVSEEVNFELRFR